MDDVALTFDPTPFLAGLDAINSGIGSMNDHFKGMAKAGTEKTNQVQLSAVNLLGVFAKLGAVVGVFKFALSGIPEIGQTFKIAGDIFQRNLLWPLRKELVPILQSVLDWVRDNRAMFVKWGSVVANIFRAVFSIVKQLISTVKNLFSTLFNELERVFGKTTNTITETVNLILFKITAVLQFIFITLEPIFQWMVKQFVKIIGYIKSFVQGFINGFGDITPVLKDFKNLWDRISELFGRIAPQQSKLNSGFSAMGSILGTVVLGVLLGVVSALDLLVTGVEETVNRLEYMDAFFSKDRTKMLKLDKERIKINKDFEKRIGERADLIKNSAVATKNLIFGTGGNEKENNLVMPLPKGQISNNNKSEMNVVNDNKNVTININGAQNPEKVGSQIKNTLDSQLREARFRSGGR